MKGREGKSPTIPQLSHLSDMEKAHQSLGIVKGFLGGARAKEKVMKVKRSGGEFEDGCVCTSWNKMKTVEGKGGF